MNKMNKIFSSSLLVILMAAFLFSCQKDISKIGVNVVGSNPLVVTYMDTITVRVHSELIDTLRSDELSSHVLGAYKDPTFGMLNASVYSQFRLPVGGDSWDFGEGAVLDSIILYIKYANTDIYGDTNYAQHLTVYEVGEDMSREDAYFSNQNLRIKNDVLGDKTFIPRFDSIVDPNDTSKKIIRPINIPLSNEFGERLLNLDTSAYDNIENFLNEFKGLYITTLNENLPSSGGALVNTDFEDGSATYIGLYYHNNDKDSLVYKYVVNFNAAHFSNFNHYGYQDATADFRQQVIDGDTTLGEQKIYMQGLAGVRTLIEFPYLNKMPDFYNYSVNDAKLFVYDIDTTSGYSAISSLTLSQELVVDSVANYYLISDASSGDRYFSGKYNFDGNRYYFRITQYIQDLIAGRTPGNKLRIEIVGGAVHPNRLVAAGWNPTADLQDKKIQLQLIYTKIDND